GRRLREIEAASPKLAGERRPRIVVVGGGSTGTELAAEIATADWTAIADPKARPPEVVLLTGVLPFLAGLPPRLVEHARELLHEAGVAIVYGWNVVRVEPDRVELEDGSRFVFDAAVWCAGLQAAPLIRELPVPHAHGGRIAVDEHLEIPGFEGCFAVGDVIEYRDPVTGLTVPGTAQAALAEARVAAAALVARATGAPLLSFHYRERGTIVAIGKDRGAGALGRITLWGRPAALVKKLVQRDYSKAVERGETSRVL
ncbi:MAG: NAD(P)/FAD-dependent oxidoreductase, partial [Thermoplasmata archaeon]